jgi:hypothetical protein
VNVFTATSHHLRRKFRCGFDFKFELIIRKLDLFVEIADCPGSMHPSVLEHSADYPDMGIAASPHSRGVVRVCLFFKHVQRWYVLFSKLASGCFLEFQQEIYVVLKCLFETGVDFGDDDAPSHLHYCEYGCAYA